MKTRFNLYEETHYHRSVHGESEDKSWSHLFELISFNRYLILRKYFHPNSSILEIGSGPGWNLKYFNNLAISAVEPSTLYNAFYACQGIKLYKSLENVSGTYSQILLSHVLEHVENPLQFLIETKSLLSVSNSPCEGQLIMLLPNEASGIFRRQSRKQDQHLYCFNEVTISNLLEKAGFKAHSVTLIPYGYELFIAKIFFSRFQLCTLSKVLYIVLLRSLQLFLMKTQYLVIAYR